MVAGFKDWTGDARRHGGEASLSVVSMNGRYRRDVGCYAASFAWWDLDMDRVVNTNEVPLLVVAPNFCIDAGEWGDSIKKTELLS